jgi:hypothetical protein
MYCVLGISTLLLSTIFVLNIRTVPTVMIFFVLNLRTVSTVMIFFVLNLRTVPTVMIFLGIES